MLAHLARAAYFSSGRNAYVAVFTAYFDASGKESSRVMAVAGFVSRIPKWDRFEKAWKDLLPPTVSMFHMTDFVTSRKGWESWKGQSQRRAKLVEDLVSCIKLHTNKGFAGSVQMSEYNLVDQEFQLREYLGSAYSFLGLGELGRLKNWADKKDITIDKILCVFEDGDDAQGDLIKRARADGFNAVPQSKKNVRAFDACDLGAWKAKTAVDDGWERKLHLSDPKAADRIIKATLQIGTAFRGQEPGMYSAEAIRRACIAHGVPKRRT
jgi:hypothetical protein